MPGKGIEVGRLAGIPISVHPLWLVVVALITFSLGSAYYPEAAPDTSAFAAYALGLASALLLFASILLHELGHAVIARRYGVEIEGIQLWLLGGVASMKGAAHRPEDELRYALAGPGVTVAIMAVFAIAALALPASAPDALGALLAYQAWINGVILAFNMVPAFPLDGGRVLRALLWRRWQDLNRATTAAARVGRGFAYFLISIGVLALFGGVPGGLWFALIGFFLIFAGRSEEEALRLKATFEHLGLRRVMAVPAVTIPARTSVEEALREYFVPFGYRSFPVVDGTEVAGLLSIEMIETLPPSSRSENTVGEVADRDPSLIVSESVTTDELLASGGFARHGRALVICRDGEVGILSATALERAMRAARLLTAPSRPPAGSAAEADAHSLDRPSAIPAGKGANS